jgi:prolipoprotein diacylglyceryltransferase
MRQLLIFLYSAVFYIAYWKTDIIRFSGRTLGATLALCFFARFMIEFVKENQVPFENNMPLDMGQLLSIPFIATGLYLIYMSRNKAPAT